MGAALSEIKFVEPHVFLSQKLKKLQEAESLPFCPTDAAFFLYTAVVGPGYGGVKFIKIWVHPQIYTMFCSVLASCSGSKMFQVWLD